MQQAFGALYLYTVLQSKR